MDFLLADQRWLWLAIMIGCIVFEAITFNLTTIWAAISALLMIFVCNTGLDFKWQLLIFLVVTILLIVFTRPFALKKLKLGKTPTNVNAMEGQEVLVLKAISKFQKGEVKAANGVIWSATSQDGTDIAENTVCVVTKIDGNTLTVKNR